MFSSYGMSFLQIISLDNVAAEIVRSLAGRIGLIFTVPITAVSADLLRRKEYCTDDLPKLEKGKYPDFY